MPNRYLFIIIYLISFFSFAQDEDYSKNVNALFDKAFTFYKTDVDSLSFYLDKVNKIAVEHSDIEALCDSYNAESWNASYFGELNLMKRNISTLDSLVDVFEKEFNQSSVNQYYKCQINYTKGQYYNELKAYETSKPFFDKIINTCENSPQDKISEDLMTLFLESNIYMALMLTDENKFSLAEDYLNKNIRLIDNQKMFQSELNNTKTHLANIYKQNKDYQKSNRTILKCLPFYENNNNSNRMITGYKRIIENHIDLKQLDSATLYLKSLRKWLPDDHQLLTLYYSANSSILEAKMDYKNALIASEKRLDILNKKWEGKHIEIANAYQKIAEIHVKLNQPEIAIKTFNIALQQFSNDDKLSSLDQATIFKILNHKTTTLNKIHNYASSIKSSSEAIIVLDGLKPTFTTKNDKLFLIENAFPLFENGIEAAYNLYQETNDSKYIDEAFFYSEKSKSTLLLESILSSQATTFANIPEELIEKEKQLKAKITYLEKQINKKSTPKLQDQLFDIKQIHRNLIKDIEVNYKPYFDLKYNTQVLSLNALQNWLDNDTKLISYFYGNQSIYTISITKNTSHIAQLKLDKDFEILLKESYDLLSNPKSNLTLLKAKTHELYQKLVLNSLSKSSKENLIIVPDGLLNYLPFGSLSINDNKYLIQNHAISYANSATLLMQLQSKKQHNNQILAFAPSFDNSTASQLLSLPNNTKEVHDVLSHFEGKSFINEKASLENFNLNNKDFGIIHLATHAILDDENPEYSYLAFSPNSQNENLLYTNDLYNLELNSNMVTLSACETGLGHLKKGEGMMSLARGFYFSGTSSIASTLWKVNDASSSQLMTDFYNQLSEGKTKDDALQLAKINFINLNKDNALSHPYYWSGFIISGNTNALAPSNTWQYFAIGIVALIVLSLLFYKKNRRRKT